MTPSAQSAGVRGLRMTGTEIHVCRDGQPCSLLRGRSTEGDCCLSEDFVRCVQADSSDDDGQVCGHR